MATQCIGNPMYDQLLRFSDLLHSKYRYLNTVSTRNPNVEMSKTPAETVEEIATEFDKLLAVLLIDAGYTQKDNFISRIKGQIKYELRKRIVESEEENIVKLAGADASVNVNTDSVVL